MRAQALPRMSFSLARSYNRLAFTTSDLQEIGRNHSDAAVPREFSCAMRECQSLISSQAQHIQRFACRCNAIFRDRRSTLKLSAQISWQAQYFKAFRGRRSTVKLACRFRGRRSTLGGVESLSLRRGAHLEIAKSTLCALWAARRTF